MPACARRIQHFDIAENSVLQIETSGNADDYSTTVQIESEASPPGRTTLPNSTTQNKTRDVQLHGSGQATTVRFLTTFKSAAAATVTLKATIAGNGAAAQPLLSCTVSGRKGDPADYRLLWLSST